jgi:hypothetical protein
MNFVIATGATLPRPDDDGGRGVDRRVWQHKTTQLDNRIPSPGGIQEWTERVE